VLGDSKISKSYGMGDLLPVTFLIDKAGKIRVVKRAFGIGYKGRKQGQPVRAGLLVSC
jgi:hypothetical protein